VIRITEFSVALNDCHLAHFGHGSQATGQLADDFLFVRAQLAEVDGGRRESDAQRIEMLDFVHHGGNVKQRFGGDATDVQAHATERGVAFDEDDFKAQICCAKCSGITTGASAQHHQIELLRGLRA